MLETKMVRRKRWLSFVFAMCFAMMFSLMAAPQYFGGVETVLANSGVSAESARRTLTNNVSTSMSANSYELEGGGYVKGSSLWTQGDDNAKYLDETQFKALTSKAQEQVVADIAASSTEQVGKDGISNQTVENWWKELQQINGVGTKFLNTILANTKPDFVSANNLYKPFSGVVGTVLGLGAVLLMAFLGIVMVMDISYITLPPVRLFVSDDENGEKIAKSKMFTHDAIYAVQKAEGDSQGNGSPKQALGIYLKRRIIALILLGICLMYLVQGQLYTFVGWILDLLNGFLGF